MAKKRTLNRAKAKLRPQEINDPERQVTLQFFTVAEKKLWMQWYRRSGCRHFSCMMMQYGPRWWKTKKGLYWRKQSESKLENWPWENERFV